MPAPPTTAPPCRPPLLRPPVARCSTPLPHHRYSRPLPPPTPAPPAARCAVKGVHAARLGGLFELVGRRRGDAVPRLGRAVVHVVARVPAPRARPVRAEGGAGQRGAAARCAVRRCAGAQVRGAA
eukprot:2401490-Prymnesium_polylepis.1